MNNPSEILRQFQQFKADFTRDNPNVSPRDFVQQMMNQGKISQQNFEKARSFVASMGFKV